MPDVAAKAVARHLRGLNLQGADPNVVALEILQVLRGHGWRPTQAQPPAWQPPARPVPPDIVRAYAAKARAAITQEDA